MTRHRYLCARLSRHIRRQHSLELDGIVEMSLDHGLVLLNVNTVRRGLNLVNERSSDDIPLVVDVVVYVDILTTVFALCSVVQNRTVEPSFI